MKQKAFPFTPLAIMIFFFFAGCEKQIDQNNLRIRYGTSFGFCIGYCSNKVEVTRSKMSLTKFGRGDTIKTKTCTKTINETQWASIVNAIDLKKFQELDDVIGCPDCADGGAEWIEIEAGNEKHKVVFEYGKEPVEMKGYIQMLRGFSESFKDCN